MLKGGWLGTSILSRCHFAHKFPILLLNLILFCAISSSPAVDFNCNQDQQGRGQYRGNLQRFFRAPATGGEKN